MTGGAGMKNVKWEIVIPWTIGIGFCVVLWGSVFMIANPFK